MTPYRAGKDFERRVKVSLEQDGYGVTQSGGSKGPADLWAAKAAGTPYGHLLHISVKRRNPLIKPSERAALLELAHITGGLPIVAYQPAPRKPIAYRRLLGNGPKDWISWHPDEVADATVA